eukprot:23462-Ditylum_brightwellii.AAC.1
MIASLVNSTTCRLLSYPLDDDDDDDEEKKESRHCTIEFEQDITSFLLVSEQQHPEKQDEKDPSSASTTASKKSYRKRKFSTMKQPQQQQTNDTVKKSTAVLIVITRDGTMWRSAHTNEDANANASHENDGCVCWSTGKIKATKEQQQQSINDCFQMVPCQIEHNPRHKTIFPSPFWGINKLVSSSSSHNNKGGILLLAHGTNTLSPPLLLHIPPPPLFYTNFNLYNNVVTIVTDVCGLEYATSRITSMSLVIRENNDCNYSNKGTADDDDNNDNYVTKTKGIWDKLWNTCDNNLEEKEEHIVYGCILLGLEDGSVYCSFLLSLSSNINKKKEDDDDEKGFHHVTTAKSIFSLRKGIGCSHHHSQSVISLLYVSSSASLSLLQQHEYSQKKPSSYGKNSSGDKNDDAIICVGSMGDIAILFNSTLQQPKQYKSFSSSGLFMYAASSSSSSSSQQGGYTWTSASSLNTSS